ncbi:MAG: ParB/RepB/Spo0J family partition protein, partial [Chthoniobacterales bacterium]
MAKPSLGRGLGALISPSKAAAAAIAAAEAAGDRVQSVALTRVVPSPLQPRSNFAPELLTELVDSIRENGIIQPLIVREVGGLLELIAGERRWRAAGQAGLKEVPVIVREATDLEVLELALVENLQRSDLNPIEEAQAYARLANEFKLKQDDIAKKVG